MVYQVSLEGHIDGRHTQLNFYDAVDYAAAMKEVEMREHLPSDPAEEWIALLFNDRMQAIKDGIPENEIEILREGESPLFGYKAAYKICKG